MANLFSGRGFDAVRKQHNDHRFRTPTDLALTALEVRRILIVGSCLSQVLAAAASVTFEGANLDHILYNMAGELPDQPPQPISEYDFQIVNLPLRTAMPEALFFPLNYDDLAGFNAALEHCEQRLLQLLEGAVAYHARHGITTFVTNFMCPQQNSMGRLLAQNDARNPAWFVRRLNDVIADYVERHSNMYLINCDEIAAGIGRRYIQDDILAMTNHGSFLSDWDFEFDQARLEMPQRPSACYDIRTGQFIAAFWSEVASMVRTIRQQDQIKLVICDLDDTLWRGVIAEEGEDRPALFEGWPLGLFEALSVLRRRGILLAVVSKNDEHTIRRFWARHLGNIPLDKFAVVKINWEPKEQNIEAVLRETNLLARNALFIDDNPVERDRVQRAHPDIRTLGADLYYLRRVLLWSAETQVATVTEESVRRTQMVQRQIARETARQALPRGEFLASLNVEVTRSTIADVSHARFARAFELVNKSNQFNTTGRRWAQEECKKFFAGGGRFEAFHVRDRFTDYGLVAVAIVSGATIEQFVMSCRVIGLDVELAAIIELTAALLSNGSVHASVRQTDANHLSRDLYARVGYARTGDTWTATKGSLMPMPRHVAMKNDGEVGPKTSLAQPVLQA